MIYTIEDFSKQHDLSDQAKMAIYMHIVFAIAISAYTFNKTSNFVATILALNVYVIFSTVGIYAINCLSKGKCDTYAWFATVVQLLNVLIVIHRIRKIP